MWWGGKSGGGSGKRNETCVLTCIWYFPLFYSFSFYKKVQANTKSTMLRAKNLGKLKHLKMRSTKVMPMGKIDEDEEKRPPKKRMFAVDMMKQEEDDERKMKQQVQDNKLGGFSWSAGKKGSSKVETKETKETMETMETMETKETKETKEESKEQLERLETKTNNNSQSSSDEESSESSESD